MHWLFFSLLLREKSPPLGLIAGDREGEVFDYRSSPNDRLKITKGVETWHGIKQNSRPVVCNSTKNENVFENNNYSEFR